MSQHIPAALGVAGMFAQPGPPSPADSFPVPACFG